MNPYQKMVLRLLIAILEANNHGSAKNAGRVIADAEALIKDLES